MVSKRLKHVTMYIVSVVAIVGCRQSHDPQRPPISQTQPPIAVQTLVLHPTDLHRQVRRVSMVEPSRRAMLGSKLLTRVLDVRVKEGSRVGEGTPLILLDSRDLQAKSAQVRATALAVSAQAHVASDEAARATHLGDSGVFAQAQVDSIQGGAIAANAQATSAWAALSELHITQQESVVTAPFDGLVVRKNTEVGSFSAPGQPLIVFEDDSSLRVLTPIAAREASGLAVGTNYPIVFESSVRVSGKLETIVPSGEPRSPGLVAIFRVPNADHTLRAGTVANVEIAAPESTPVLLVPESAIVSRGGLTGVFVVDNHRLRLVWCVLETSMSAGQFAALDGLHEADSIVVEGGQPGLEDGREVVR